MSIPYTHGEYLIDIRLDEVDRKIIGLMQENPKLSQSQIARMVELSQPSVSARIKRLKEAGFISLNVGADIKKAGLHVAKIDFPRNRDLKGCISCPYILGIVETEDVKTIYVVGEDFSSIESVVKKSFGVNGIKAVISSHPNFIMPLKMSRDGKCSSCECESCEYYVSGKCLGCPLSSYYKGKLW